MTEETTVEFHELVYSGEVVKDKIRARFPSLQITDAPDDFYTEVFEVVGDISKDDFYVFAIREGFATVCFSFAMMVRVRLSDAKERLKKWIERAAEEENQNERTSYNMQHR